MKVLASLLQQLNVGLIALDANLSVLEMNAEAEALLHLSARRARAQRFEDLLPLTCEWRARALDALRERRHLQLLEVTLGHEQVVDMRLLPLPADAAAAWLVEINAVTRRAQPSPPSGDSADQRALLRAVGHEVKNPLAGLRGAAQLLAREQLSTDGLELTELIEREVDRLSALIDRWGETEARTHFRRINLHEAMEHVHRLMAAELRGRVVIERDYDVSLASVRADLNRLIQALINLLRNADQAHATRIVLRTRLNDPGGRAHARLSVIDNGHGVPPALMPRIFEPLVTGRAEGLGLGLSIVSAVAQEHGGRVEVKSQPGATEFALVLPLAD